MNKNHSPIENHIDFISKEIEKRRSKWTLSALSWMDFDDVKQIILIHISKKWEQYDSKKPLINWISVIISNQFKNLLRNVYGNYSRPCLKCSAMEGNENCRIYGTQNSACSLYKKWENGKRYAYNTRLPLPIENHSQEVSEMPHQEFDLEKSAAQIHEKMKKILTKHDFWLYDMIFIKHLTDEEILSRPFFKIRKNSGKTTIKIFKKSILEKVKQIINSDEIDF